MWTWILYRSISVTTSQTHIPEQCHSTGILKWRAIFLQLFIPYAVKSDCVAFSDYYEVICVTSLLKSNTIFWQGKEKAEEMWSATDMRHEKSCWRGEEERSVRWTVNTVCYSSKGAKQNWTIEQNFGNIQSSTRLLHQPFGMEYRVYINTSLN